MRPRGERNTLVRDTSVSEKLHTGHSAARADHGKAALRLVLPGIDSDYGSAEWGRLGKDMKSIIALWVSKPSSVWKSSCRPRTQGWKGTRDSAEVILHPQNTL